MLRLNKKMAACFSSANVFATPPVYVLSQIPKLAECLTECALPGIQIKPVDLPSEFKKDLQLNDDQLNYIQNAEIIVCDGYLLEKSYKNMPKLKWAHCTWAGVESLVKNIKEEPPFLVTRHAGEAFSGMMAEYVMCQILNYERDMKTCWKNQEIKNWGRMGRFETYRTLDELTVAILGVGNMATGIAKMLKARGTTVLGLSRTPRPYQAHHGIFDNISTSLDEILPACDYLCNSLPCTPFTRGMLNNSVLEKCLKKPVFINIGRGSIISEKELVHALRKEWLSGAVLDVFEKEPLPESSELWEMQQVTITPHVAAVSKAEHIAEEFFKNFSQYIDGHGIENAVNWNVGY